MDQCDTSATLLTLRAGAKAFGDGKHPTTRLIGQLLREFSDKIKPQNILDMGCGSGILSLQAALLYSDIPIIAADIEEKAVSATLENAQANGMASQINAVRSDGYSHAHIKQQAPYSLIICNILAEPLVAMAHDAANMLANDSHIMLSGILSWQADSVRNAYEAAGLTALEGLEADNWVAMVLRKSVVE